MGEKKGFFSRLVEGLTKTRDILYPELIRYFTVFLKLMMNFTRNWKKF